MEIKTVLTAEDLYYPRSKPFNEGWLDVGDGHELHYFECGNPDGEPVILVHGGPGGGLDVGGHTTRLHDPTYFRIIALEQRGCGLSKPHVSDDRKAALYKNDPMSLARDFEKLRKHLGVDRWHVYGYSWGSGLGTLYASKFPKAVRSLTIGGIWLHTPREIDWYINYMGLFMPEHEEKLLKLLPKGVQRFNRLTWLYRTITGPSKAAALKLAEVQGNYEFMSTFFNPPVLKALKPKGAKAQKKEKLRLIALGALEIFFMYKHPLAASWYKSATTRKALKSIKNFQIIQGRYDVVCPPVMAYELHKLYPHSTLIMVQHAGHATREIDMLGALIRGNNRLKTLR